MSDTAERAREAINEVRLLAGEGRWDKARSELRDAVWLVLESCAAGDAESRALAVEAVDLRARALAAEDEA